MAVSNTARLQRSRLTAALLSALLLSTNAAIAQERQEQNASTDEQTTNLDQVVVTGSRIKRAEIEGPAPITVITANDIEKEGFTTVYDALNTLTQFTGSVQNEFNQNGFTPNASFLNLRGLGPGYQLILINGRRAADYPLPYNSESNAVNLANIPAAAIERIEILTGGASAIYGSDAVAGVVNIILKSNFDGDQLTVRAGTTTRGGGDTGQVQWVGGKTGENWSVTYAFESLEREALYASQRDFMDSYFDDPSVPDQDVNPVEGLLAFDLFDSNRLFPDGAETTCGRFGDFDTFFFETSAVYTGPRCGYFGYPATQAIRNSDSNQSFYVSGTMDFTDNLQGFAQLYHTRAKAKLTSGVQFWSTPGIYLANVQSPFLEQFGVPGSYAQLQRIFTPAETGNSLVTTIEEKSFDFAAGLRGTFADGRFDWDATLSRAQYELDSRTPRFLANPLQEYFLGQPLAGGDILGYGYDAYNLNIDRFYNPIDPATFASLNTIVRDKAETSVNQASFVVSGDIFELPAGSVGMAAVLEAASQEYEINPDPRTNPNYSGPEPIYNLTSTGGRGDRDRYAAGLELSVPILSSLKLNAAGRWDKYVDASAIDNASTWQVGLEWRPFSNLLIRGSHGTSFRAPDMHYVYAEESGFFTSIFDEYKCRRDGFDPRDPSNPCSGADYNYQVQGTRAGDRNLEAEKGKSTTVGFVWDVMDDMSLSLDYYAIELRDAVADISGLLFRNEADCLLGETREGAAVDPTSAACQFYTGLVNREDAGGPFNDGDVTEFRSFPINQSLNRTSGIDAAWRYKLDTDRMGEFTFGLNWTHVLKLEQQEFEGEPVEDIRDHPQFFNNRSRISGNVVWEKSDWTTAVYYTRWGSLPNWAETGRIGPQILWNLNVSKEITEKATLGLYVNNVFDRIHPRDDTFNTYPFFWRQFSPIGREVFVQFDYKFN